MGQKVRVISPGTADDDLPKKYRKWNRLYPLHYVGCCGKGCHGQSADSFNAAYQMALECQTQCEAEYAAPH